MIYTRTALAGDNVTARRTLQRSVAQFRERLTTALYREYLKRTLIALDAARDKVGNRDPKTADALHLICQSHGDGPGRAPGAD